MTGKKQTPWEGEMLDNPEMMAAFAAQLRAALRDYAAYVDRVRRDAEAMWKANPPKGYSSFEAWWRHQQVVKPFRRIQQFLEAAEQETFPLEANHRRWRHEVPAERLASRGHHKALTSGASTARPAVSAPRPEQTEPDTEPVDFLTLLKQQQHGRRRTA